MATRKHNGSIIPPGVDGLPSSPASGFKKRFPLQSESKGETGQVMSTILDKCNDAKAIHKPSPMRRALEEADPSDNSDVSRFNGTLIENRRKSEQNNHKMDISISSTVAEILQAFTAEKHADSSTPDATSQMSESVAGTADIMDSTAMEAEPTIAEKQSSINGCDQGVEVITLTDSTTSTKSIGENASDESWENAEQEMIVGDIKATSPVTSSDDSSVEGSPGKKERNQFGYKTKPIENGIEAHDTEQQPLDDDDISDNQLINVDDVDIDDVVLEVKKMRKDDGSSPETNGHPVLQDSSLDSDLSALLTFAKMNNEMEIDLRKIDTDQHQIYCVLSDIESNSSPRPYPLELQDADYGFGRLGYLKVPWSPLNLEKHITDGVRSGSSRIWISIRRSLRPIIDDGLATITDFTVAVRSYKPDLGCKGIKDYYNALSELEQRKMLDVLYAATHLVLQGPELFHKGIRLLKKIGTKSLTSATFSREQCACLLANSFFCTFPEGQKNMNGHNMADLLSDPNVARQKMKFLLTYFESVSKNMPTGCVTFSRRSLSQALFPDWKNVDKLLSPVVLSDQPIEDLEGCLQVDFANKFIGGGVLSTGAVQEEIRFLICPEMIVSLFICPKMEDEEAIHIYGAKRFSSYAGYASSLKWKKFCPSSPEICDIYGRTICELVAIDAINFGRNTNQQFWRDNLDRELNKAYVGFLSECQDDPRPVATGNWGCGVFGGDKQYKSLIQLMAASVVGRNIIYVPFDSKQFGNNLKKVNKKLIERGVTVGLLYQTLAKYRPRNNLEPFDFVMEMTKDNSGN